MCAPPILRGCRILYTRNRENYCNFYKQIHNLAPTIVHLPLMDYQICNLDAAQKQQLKMAQHLIFTSANAVTSLLQQYVPTDAQLLISIGKKTSNELKKHNIIANITAPPPYNSESLLDNYSPKMQSIAIIAARQGRMLLYHQLRRDNEVSIIYSYQRYNPSKCIGANYIEPCPHYVVMASCRTLDNLIAISRQHELKMLQSRAILVALSINIARYAYDRGFTRAIYTESATEAQLIELIIANWQQQQENFNER